MSKYKTGKEKRARRAEKAAKAAEVEKRQLDHLATLPQYMMTGRSRAHNLANPDAEPQYELEPSAPFVPRGALEAMAQELSKPAKARTLNVIEQAIYTAGNAGVPWHVTARDWQMSVKDAREMYDRLIKEESHFEPAAMRIYLTHQIQSIINSLKAHVVGGSPEHTKLMLLGIERLSKMHDLESTKAAEEYELISARQARLVIQLAKAMAEEFIATMKTHEIEVAPEIIDAAVFNALESSAVVMKSALEERVEA